MKKLLSVLLALVLLLGMLPATAAAAEEYVYPMSAVEKLPGTIRNSDNKYVIVNGYYGAVIDLQGMDYDTVTITKNATAPNMGYAFLCDMPTVGEVPDYAGGFYAVVWDKNPSVQLTIPEEAGYLYIYYNSNDIVYLPASVVFQSAPEEESREPDPTEDTQEDPYDPEPEDPYLDADSIKVATWNIGHFSIGKNTSTKLTDAGYRDAYNSYCAYLYDEIGADLITLNEYSAMFTPSYRAKNTIFSAYTATQFEGTQYRYSCNALYARLPVDGLRMRTFSCNQSATINHTNLIKATDYYYLQGEITLGGESVVVVTAHLAFDTTKNPDTVCLNQIDELIRNLEGYDRVLLLGDWNTREFTYFDRFAAAGYTLGNENPYRVTCGNRSLDNIIVKGLEVSDFTVHTTGLSDHYAVSATIALRYDTPEHTHSYTSVVTPATCTQPGFTTFTCASCGDSYKGENVEAKGHAQKTVEGVAATCLQPGTTNGIECADCGTTLQAQEAVPAPGHSYGDWEINDQGETVRICAVCGSVHKQGEPEEVPQTVPVTEPATAPREEASAGSTVPAETTRQTTQPTQAGQPREGDAPLPLLWYIAGTLVVAAVGVGIFLVIRKKKK